MVETSSNESHVVNKPRNLYSNRVLRIAVDELDVQNNRNSFTSSRITFANMSISPKSKERRLKTFTGKPKLMSVVV